MEEINRSRKLFHSLIENNNNIFLLVDDKLNILFRNSSLERIAGWPEDKYKKLPVDEHLHPKDRERFETMISEALANPGEAIQAAVRIKHKDGYYLWMEGVITNKLSDKDITAIVINLTDVSKRKKAEQKIVKINRLYHFISQLNQMIVRAADEKSLFKEACHLRLDSVTSEWRGSGSLTKKQKYSSR